MLLIIKDVRYPLGRPRLGHEPLPTCRDFFIILESDTVIDLMIFQGSPKNPHKGTRPRMQNQRFASSVTMRSLSGMWSCRQTHVEMGLIETPFRWADSKRMHSSLWSSSSLLISSDEVILYRRLPTLIQCTMVCHLPPSC